MRYAIARTLPGQVVAPVPGLPAHQPLGESAHLLSRPLSLSCKPLLQLVFLLLDLLLRHVAEQGVQIGMELRRVQGTVDFHRQRLAVQVGHVLAALAAR